MSVPPRWIVELEAQPTVKLEAWMLNGPRVCPEQSSRIDRGLIFQLDVF
jgi:hypothetical protein